MKCIKDVEVLDYYSEAGLVDVRPLSLPEYQPNIAGLQHLYMDKRRRSPKVVKFEVISLNDCLYRNMYRWCNKKVFHVV